MYTAIHSYSFRRCFKEPGFTIDRALQMSAEMGFTSIEVMTGKAGSIEDIGTDTVEGLERVIGVAEKLGVKIHCYSTYNDFAFVKNETWRRANVEYIKTWLKLAGETGVPNIRMLTGYYGEGQDRTFLNKLVEDGIRECLPVAEAARVNMAIENHSSVYETGAEIVDLIARLGSKRLTTCPDPSNGFRHFFDADCPMSEREALYANAKKMAPLATNSHLKIKGVTGNALVAWDIDRLVGIYADAGYDGPITFESIAEPDLIAPLAKAREIVEAAIRRQARKQ